MPLSDCYLIRLPTVPDHRGELSFIQENDQVPFAISRIYTLAHVPKDSSRGGHAHKTLQQLIVPITGSFDIHLDDGHHQACYHLDQANVGLYLCPMVWRTISHFSADAVALVLASLPYDPFDYVRDYDQFRRRTALAS